MLYVAAAGSCIGLLPGEEHQPCQVRGGRRMNRTPEFDSMSQCVPFFVPMMLSRIFLEL